MTACPPACSPSRPRPGSWTVALAALTLAICLAPACAPVAVQPDAYTMPTGEALKQQEAATRDFLAKKTRLRNVATPLLLANTELCGEAVAPLFGFALFTSGANEGMLWGPVLDMVRNAGDRVLVVSVDKGSPAEAAGMQEGDVLAAVNGVTLAAGRYGLSDALKAVEKAQNASAPLTLGLVRQDQALSVSVAPRLACDSAVMLRSAPEVIAYGANKMLLVNTALLDYVRSDDELSVLLGYELAHNTLAKAKEQAQQGGAILGGLLGLAVTGLTGVNVANLGAGVGNSALSRDIEHSADYLGLYYAARAGADITVGPDLWRRLAAQHPAVLTQGYSRSPAADRFPAMEAAVQEIRAKQAAGQPLAPNTKGE